MSRLMVAAAEQQRLGGERGDIVVNLYDLLVEPINLATTVDGEVYALSNQQTPPGDGKSYRLNSVGQGSVKSIQARFRYVANVSHLSSAYFARIVEGELTDHLGLMDDWSNQAGTNLYSDAYSRVKSFGNIDMVLKRTFVTPVRMSDLVLKIGGRAGYPFSPIFVSNVVLELI